jgi:hypothetical protein
MQQVLSRLVRQRQRDSKAEKVNKIQEYGAK